MELRIKQWASKLSCLTQGPLAVAIPRHGRSAVSEAELPFRAF